MPLFASTTFCSVHDRPSMRSHFNCPLLAGILLTACVAPLAAAGIGEDDWPWWRGPNFNNVANSGEDPPREWGEGKNIVWKVPVPGRGHASPTIVGDRIFLTTADDARQTQSVVCLAREDGHQLWQTPLSQGGFPKTHLKNTHGTPTVACDGERLFVTLHHHDKLTLHALDLEGNPLWQKEVGPYSPKLYEYGYAPSPLIYRDLVIVAADYECGGCIAAYERESGNRKYRETRPNSYSFSSPVVANIAGRDQLLLSGCDAVASYNPSTGKMLWVTPGTTMATCGTIVWDGDLVFASGGYPKAETLCVRADGSRQVVWRNGEKCYEQSMLAHDGYVYALNDQGIAFCWRGSDGQEMWKRRLGGPVSTSPVLVGNTIYAMNEAGTTFVFEANPNEFVEIAANQLGNEGFATPSFCGDRVYLRTAVGDGPSRQEYLYCIGQ
jgi:outer membrane protein assembly factor BamB